VLWESIRNKITRKIIIFYLGGWKAQGIPKGGFGRVLARKAKNGEKFSSAGRFGLRGLICTDLISFNSLSAKSVPAGEKLVATYSISM
jgi:hypothetical protein